MIEPPGDEKALRKNWARLIQKIYEVDPLICPKCHGKMRITSFIENGGVIRAILEHLGLRLARSRPPPKIHAPPLSYEPQYTDPPPHQPSQYDDCYAAPNYAWDEYLQS